MKSIAERHKFIVEQLARKGFVTVQELAEALQVTAPTIRKDLSILEGQKVLIKAHGSASPMKPHVMDQNIKVKAQKNIAEKNRIAREALKLISPEDAVILASGSTVTAFAEILRPVDSLNVVTPSLGIAFLLNDRENIDVMVLGGKMYKNSLSVRGEYAVAGLKNVSCSKLFIGCDGVDMENGITCSTIEEARLTIAMMAVCARTVVLVDSTKFGRRGFGRICRIEDIDLLITDSGIPGALREEIEAAGTQVIIAE